MAGNGRKYSGEAVRHLQESYGAEPKNIKAGIGPAIGKSVFEVEKDVVEAFEKIFDKEEMKRLSAPKGEGKILIDLPLANRILIERAGILPENIEDCGICTYCRNDLFYSLQKSGRQNRTPHGGNDVEVMDENMELKHYKTRWVIMHRVL